VDQIVDEDCNQALNFCFRLLYCSTVLTLARLKVAAAARSSSSSLHQQNS
jgi:hypothetical protein